MSRERWSDLETPEKELLEQLGLFNPSDVSRICPPPELLRASREEMLPADVRAKLQAHVTKCRLCQALEHDLRELSNATLAPDADDRIRSRLSATPERLHERSASRRIAWWRPALALAAAGVLAVVVIPRLWPGVSPPAAVAPAPRPEPQRVAAADLIPIDKPPVKLTPSVLVYRTPDTKSERILKDLEPAFDAYRQDDYSTAAQRFDALNPRYSGSVEVQFYLGVCRLFLNDYQGAAAAFEAAQNVHDQTFSEDVAWYLMLAHQRAGDLRTAEGERRQICDGHGAYSSKACAARVQ